MNHLKIFFIILFLPTFFGCILDPQVPPLDAGIEAARKTAQQNPACTVLGDFYWSIGDAHKRLGNGQVGTAFSPYTRIPLYSASKLVFSTYVIEKKSGALTPSLISGLNFTSGYVGPSEKICLPADTIGSCFDRDLNTFNPGKVGQFFYASGHMQKIAAQDLNLYTLNRQTFATEIMNTLGTDLGLTFDVNFFGFQAGPVAAGGMNMTPVGYETLLKNIISGHYLMLSYLGAESVSTTAPGMRYSLGHWIESDGSFSSIGALGFYPWIDSSKQYWGILARAESNFNNAINAPAQSMACGQKIRKAYMTKTAQLN